MKNVTRKTVGQRVSEVEKKVQKMSSNMAVLNKITAKNSQLLQFVDERKTVKHLDKLKIRITELSRRFQTNLLKLLVCSEVPRVYPEVWPKVVLALDRDDEWWDAGDSLKISEWKERLDKAALEHVH